MAFIISKKVNGQSYYYLRQMARVDGKPKLAWERYLGKAEDIEAALDGSLALPERTRHLRFGDLAAAWSVITSLRIVEIVDDVVGPRRSDASASIGTYVALMVLKRVVAPCSKLAFFDWWATTAGDRLVHLPREALDHRRFWDAMDQISPRELAEIERRVVAQMVESFAIDCSGLVLDMTNFATYIDTGNDKAPIAQRVGTTASSSPIHRTCITCSPGALTRPSPMRATSSPSSLSAWSVARRGRTGTPF